MSEDLRERLRRKYGTPRRAVETSPAELEAARATVLDDKGIVLEVAGRTLLAAPARPFTVDELPQEVASKWAELAESAPHMMWLSGRYVEAERANRNGALWSTGDLEFGELGVRHGPLNWLHQKTKVIGTLADAHLVRADGETAADGGRPYIATTAAIWSWVYPREAAVVREFAEAGRAYQSMECVARAIECGECSSQFPYEQTVQSPSTVCEHIRERSASRRFIEPSFLGAGVILPPVAPGWAEAHVQLMPTASRLAEAACEAAPNGMSDTDFELLMASLIAQV